MTAHDYLDLGFGVSGFRGIPLVPHGRRRFLKRRFHGRGREERLMRDRSFDPTSWLARPPRISLLSDTGAIEPREGR